MSAKGQWELAKYPNWTRKYKRNARAWWRTCATLHFAHSSCYIFSCIQLRRYTWPRYGIYGVNQSHVYASVRALMKWDGHEKPMLPMMDVAAISANARRHYALDAIYTFCWCRCMASYLQPSMHAHCILHIYYIHTESPYIYEWRNFWF